MADYRDAQTYSSDAEAKKAKDVLLVVKQWWSCEDPDERAKAVSAMAKSLETNSQDRKAANEERSWIGFRMGRCCALRSPVGPGAFADSMEVRF